MIREKLISVELPIFKRIERKLGFSIIAGIRKTNTQTAQHKRQEERKQEIIYECNLQQQHE